MKRAKEVNFSEIAVKLEQILRLDTFPVAIKMYKNAEELPRKPLNFKLNICQLVSMARYAKKSNSGIPEKMVCSMGAACVGLIKTPEPIRTGRAAVGPYTRDEKAGKRFMENTFKIGDSGKKYDAIMVAPLESVDFEPDAVVLYATPAQIMRLIHANTYDTGEKTTADTVAEAALCSSIGFAISKQKPIIGFPCAGDRIFGGTQNHELLMAIPFSEMNRILKNLEETAKGGFSVYPVPPNMMWTPTMPSTYTIQEADLQDQ